MQRWKQGIRRFAGVATASALVVVGIAAAQPAGATATPPTADPAFLGTWVNANATSPNVVNVTVTSDGAGGLLVDAFGYCQPTLCEAGQVPATIYAPAGSTSSGRTFETNQDEGFKRLVLFGQLTAGSHPRLNLQEFSAFTDASGRHNYTETEHFVKTSDLAVGLVGTPATDYPGGDQPTPARGLVGTWTNTSATALGVAEFDITRAGDGTLLVHEFGVCHPVWCDNGTVPGITYGRTVGSATGSKVLVAYEYSFAREIDELSLSRHTLKAVEHIEFTDGSGRPNIVNVETFTR